MAAFNRDSKRIFDLYVNRYLLEADEGGDTKKEESGTAAKESDKSSAGATGGNAPAVGGSEASTSNPGNAVGGSEEGTPNPGGAVGSSDFNLTTGTPAPTLNAANANPTGAVSQSALGFTPGAINPDRNATDFSGGGVTPPAATTTNVNDLRNRETELGNTAQRLGLQNYNTDTSNIAAKERFTDIGAGTPTGANYQAALNSQTPAAAPTSQTPQTPSAPPSKEDIERYGRTGAELRQTSGNQFMTRADRLDQAKVDKVLGAGKYKAGTEEANLALADYFRKNPATVTPGTPGNPAGSTAPASTGSAAQAPSAPASTGAAPGVNVPKPGVTSTAKPSQQEILARVKQALGSQGITVPDDSKLMGVAKGMGLL